MNTPDVGTTSTTHARRTPRGRSAAPERGRRRRTGRILAIAALLALLVAACVRGTAPGERVTATVGPSGGVLSLRDGTRLTIAPGFLRAEARVTLSTAEPPPPVQGGDPDYTARAQRFANPVTIELPASAVALPEDHLQRSSLELYVPAAGGAVERTHELFTEIHLELADGSRHFFHDGTRPEMVDAHRWRREVRSTVELLNLQLRPTGPIVQDTVRVAIQLVAVEPLAFTEAVPDGFVLEAVTPMISGAVVFDFAAGDRIFIGRKSGVVRVFKDGTLLPTPFVSITDQVNGNLDRGMLGLAVHPEFPSMPYVYVLYTYDPPQTAGLTGDAGPGGAGARVARLVRYTADAAHNFNVAVPGSGVVLLGTNSTWANIADPAVRNGAPSCGAAPDFVRDCLPADEISHTIGTLKFGSDGALYVSNGDGASFMGGIEYATRSLHLDSLAGKILRIDPMTGAGLADNPFYDGDPGSNRSKVYSYGLRNPFRFTIHPTTGAVFVGDVGWASWEEINVGRGKDFGWPCYEGGITLGGNPFSAQQGWYRHLPECAAYYAAAGASATPPLFAYNHSGSASSVQVGDFYMGTSYPTSYKGALFFFDYNKGWIRTVHVNAQGQVTAAPTTFGTAPWTTQIKASASGDLYLMTDYPNSVLKRLRYTVAGNLPPTAVASASPTQGQVPLTVQFTGSASSDPGGGALTYAWSFGDGGTSTQANPSHTYQTPGVYTATLTVTDADSATAQATVEIAAGQNRPVVAITSPADGSVYTVGQAISYAAQGTSDWGPVPSNAFSWTLTLHHADHLHPDGFSPARTGSSGTFQAPDHGDDTYLELCVTATVGELESHPSCVAIHYHEVEVTLATDPPGLRLPWGGVERQTPFTVVTQVGGNRQLVAPQSQYAYEFQSWSTGGERFHDVIVPAAPTTYTASYRVPGDACPQGSLALLRDVLARGHLTSIDLVSASEACLRLRVERWAALDLWRRWVR